MMTADILKKRISELRCSGESGIIAMCADPGANRNDEEFYQKHQSAVYLAALDMVYTRSNWGSAYWKADAYENLGSELMDIAGSTDACTAESLGYTEKEYLDEQLSSIVWDMAHDSFECPDLDDDYGPDYYLKFPGSGLERLFLTGADSLESDIRAFRALADTDSTVTVNGNRYGVRTYESGDCPGRKVYELYKVVPEDLFDEESGETVPVERYIGVLATLDWRTLYAKSRSMFYKEK